MRAEIRVPGERAHAARSWLGHNAIHAAAPVLTRLGEHEPRVVEVDGLTFREGLNAVAITGGVAGNIIPDECVVPVNFRFAPARSEADAPDIDGRVYIPRELPVGDFVQVEITGSQDYDLLALPKGEVPAQRKVARQAQ